MRRDKYLIYAFLSNIIVLISSLFIVLILPGKMSTEQYGYFQIFLLYLSFSAILQIGWPDGILLCYGGYYENQIKEKGIHFQFLCYFLVQCILSTILFLIIRLFNPELSSFYVFIIILTITIFNCKIFFQYLLQALNCIKQYTIQIYTERCAFIVMSVMCFILEESTAIYFVFVYMLATLLAFLYDYIFYIRIGGKEKHNLQQTITEGKQNIVAGSKILLANMTDTLILGIPKWMISIYFDITVFAKTSIAFTISNIMIAAFGFLPVYLFPKLRRMDQEKLNSYYLVYQRLFQLLVVLSFLLYYPAKTFLLLLLPNYKESIYYLTLLFPMCVFSTTTICVYNVILKVKRQEKTLLIVNLLILAGSCVIGSLSVFIFHDLNILFGGIVVLNGIRCVISEQLVNKSLMLPHSYKFIYLIMFSLLFIVTVHIKKPILAIFVLLIAYSVYAILQVHKLRRNLK